MQIIGLMFGLFPFLFPKKKRALKKELEQIIETRLTFIENKFDIESISKPEVRFWRPYSSAMYIGGSIFFSYPKMLDRSEELLLTIDHEIGHHIQKTKNPNTKKTYSLECFSWFYWILNGKIRAGLLERAFQEGFASYLAYLTIGKIPKRLERAQALIESGKRKTVFLKDPDILPYILGFRSYLAIGKSKSDEATIQSGLSLKASEWIKEVEKLGS
jgi:hypothetical protein